MSRRHALVALFAAGLTACIEKSTPQALHEITPITIHDIIDSIIEHRSKIPYLAKVETKLHNPLAQFCLLQIAQPENPDPECQQQIYKMLEDLASQDLDGKLGLYADGITSENITKAHQSLLRLVTKSPAELEQIETRWQEQGKTSAAVPLCMRGHYDFRAADYRSSIASIADACAKHGLLTKFEADNFNQIAAQLHAEKCLPSAVDLGAQALLLPYLFYALKLALQDIKLLINPRALSQLPTVLQDMAKSDFKPVDNLSQKIGLAREDLDDLRGMALLRSIVANKDHLGLAIMNHGYDWTKLIIRWNKENPSKQFAYHQLVPEALANKPYINSYPSQIVEMIDKQRKLMYQQLMLYINAKDRQQERNSGKLA